MKEHISLDSWLDKFPDYLLRPCMFNLRPDKIVHFSVGLNASPEGLWDHVGYIGKDGRYVKWMEICWEVRNEFNCKLYFWIRVLSCIEKHPGKYTFPNPPTADAYCLAINDLSNQTNYGYGKDYINKILYSVDDVFKWMSEHPVLSPFFFTKKETKSMVFNKYQNE